MYRLSVILLVLLIGCQQEMPSPASALTEAEIEQVKREVQEAQDHMVQLTEVVDIDGVVATMSDHPDFLFISNGHAIGPKQQFIEDVVPGWSGNVKSEDLEEEQSKIIVLSKDAAIYFSVTTSIVTATDGTTQPPKRYVTSFVWHREGDGWKALHLTQSVLPIN